MQNEMIADILKSEYSEIYGVDLEKNTMVTARDMHLSVQDAKMAFRQFDLEVERFARYMQEPFRSTWLSFKDPEVVNEVLSTDEEVEYVYRGVDKKWRRCTIYPSGRDQNGKLVSFVVTFMYIDKLASENMELSEKVREQKEKLAAALEKAEAGSNAKTAFLFNMSHDIRTPMNAILGFNKMAEKYIDEKEKVLDCLEKVDASGQQLLSLINDILDMSRIESGKAQLELSPVKLRETENHLMDMVRETAVKDLSFITDFSGIRHDYVMADQTHRNRVLTNIAGNAVKYSKDGGTVRFSIRENEEEQAYDFIIEDDGIGMSEEFLSHIFEAFSREKSSTVSGIQGTGLGMAITKSLVDLMRGTISVESKPGEGTKVTVHLNLQPADEEGIPEEEEKIDVSLLSGKKVFLVEDNELNREIAKDILEEYGLTVAEAEDGSVAVEIYQRNATSGLYPDVILMDVQMPVMNGYEATKALRSFMKEDGKQVPIIAMTANAFDEDKKQAFEAGMDAHLAKPIVLPELEKTLTQFIAGKADRKEPVARREEEPEKKAAALKEPEAWEISISHLQEAAEKGDAKAQYLLGKRLLTEDGVAEDPEAAMEWLRKAAVRDQVDAMFLLGLEYGKRHDNVFRMWLERAAELGHPTAEKEVERIKNEAYSWEYYASNLIHGTAAPNHEI